MKGTGLPQERCRQAVGSSRARQRELERLWAAATAKQCWRILCGWFFTSPTAAPGSVPPELKRLRF